MWMTRKNQEDPKTKYPHWFCAYNPLPSVKVIMPIASGDASIVKNINCYDAMSIGATMMGKKWLMTISMAHIASLLVRIELFLFKQGTLK
ncbi:hypothetical protein AVEN_242878-1 [Araneus ventricosus]|uniref:Uncharacterized protein n=1 Tax=Araneus ventricosus TaxID=182803 RepID=A0A4Y2WR61_ARAVE|nr:hypothetical protein AVEN_155174-1 [Araneus ventricosus]GBO39669.1 hypothetical protein AVEN_242878-1 [Araneus ventricosus]